MSDVLVHNTEGEGASSTALQQNTAATVLVTLHLRRTSCQHPSAHPCAAGLLLGSGRAMGASLATDPFSILGHNCGISSGPAFLPQPWGQALSEQGLCP